MVTVEAVVRPAQLLTQHDNPGPSTLYLQLQGAVVTVDALLPDLLNFPPGTDLHDHPLVESGALILQVQIYRCTDVM